MINIITRTHNRETYFKVCQASIEYQTYKDVNWLVGADVDCPYYPQAIKLIKDNSQPPTVPDGHYHAPYNKHLNTLQEHCKEGWVMALDDDDMFMDENSLQKIASYIGDENELLVWRVQIEPKWIVPNDSFGKQITAYDFSGIGMLWNNKYKPDWGIYSLGDYRAATQIVSMGCRIKWIDEVLTRTQAGSQYGKNNIG